MTCRCVAPIELSLYFDPTSPDGREALQYVERKGIRWEAHDVVADPNALRHMQALSGQTVRPVFVVDGQVFVGCDPAVLEPLIPSRF